MCIIAIVFLPFMSRSGVRAYEELGNAPHFYQNPGRSYIGGSTPDSRGEESVMQLDYQLPQSSGNRLTHTSHSSSSSQPRTSIQSRLGNFTPSRERRLLESSRHHDDRRRAQDSTDRAREEERRRRHEARRREQEEARMRYEEECRRWEEECRRREEEDRRRWEEEERLRREEELRRQEEERLRQEEELRRQEEARIRRLEEANRRREMIVRVKANIRKILDFQETFVSLPLNEFNTLFSEIHRYRETDANRLIEHLEAYRFISLTRLCPTDFYPHFSTDLNDSVDSYMSTYSKTSFTVFTDRFWQELDGIPQPTTILDFMLNDTFASPVDAKHIPESDIIRLMWHLSNIGLSPSDTIRYVEGNRDTIRSLLYRLGYSVVVRCDQVKKFGMNDASHRVWTNKIYILLFKFLNSESFVFEHCRNVLNDDDLVFVRLMLDCYNWLSVC